MYTVNMESKTVLDDAIDTVPDHQPKVMGSANV